MLERTTRRRLSTLLAMACLVLLAACGDNGTGPNEDVESITVTATSSVLEAVDATIQLEAEAFDGDGAPVSGVTFEWTSSADDVATVDADGLVTAVANGSATIRASVTGTNGSIAIQVAQVVTELAFAAPPANGSVDVPFADLQVEARDANGHVATNFTDAVTLSIGTNPEGGGLSGQFTRNAVAGVAGFPGVSLDAAGAGYTLVASTDDLDVESDPFNVTLPSVYVTNQSSNTVSVIATASNTVVATVTVGSAPRSLALSPDGLLAYVANRSSDNVSVIETPSNTVTGTIAVGDNPEGVAFTPDGAFAYVANLNAGSVSVIETATGTVTTTITAVGSAPTDVVVTPDGATAYVVLLGADSVIVISTATNTVTARIKTDAPAFKLGITPDGAAVHATGLNADRVYVVDTGTNTFVASITPGDGPAYVAFDPDGTFGYVTNSNANTISVIDPATNTVTATFSAGAGTTPAGVDFTPDGATVYVTKFSSGTVLTIDPVTSMVTGSITVGASPIALRVMPAPLP